MKVLWFSNTPANSDEYLGLELKGTGGWLKALDQSLQNNLSLSVAFYGKKAEVFKYKNTVYYSINTKKGIFRKIIDRFIFKVIDKEDIQKYLAIIDDVKPDIIHIHGTENSFGCIIPHTTIPVVVSIQGNITVYFHKYLSGFEKPYLKVDNSNLSSLKKMLFPFSFRREYNNFRKMQIREKRNLKSVKYIIGRTLWDKRITKILAPERLYLHGDEILRETFYNNKWTPHNDRKVIIHTTNGNNFYKGFETLCLSLYELNNIGFDCEWRVAGVSPDDLIVKITKKKLKNKFPEKGLLLLGNLNEDDLVKSLLSADMYVMVSHIENSPNNLCEAMILGMPCISTFVGGVGSLIKDGQDGLLIQSGDPWSMAGTIIELAENKQLAILLSQNARSVAFKRHDKKNICEELIQTYQSIIKHHSNNK